MLLHFFPIYKSHSLCNSDPGSGGPWYTVPSHRPVTNRAQLSIMPFHLSSIELNTNTDIITKLQWENSLEMHLSYQFCWGPTWNNWEGGVYDLQYSILQPTTRGWSRSFNFGSPLVVHLFCSLYSVSTGGDLYWCLWVMASPSIRFVIIGRQHHEWGMVAGVSVFLVSAQTHVKPSKVIPTLLQQQGNWHSTQAAGCWTWNNSSKCAGQCRAMTDTSKIPDVETPSIEDKDPVDKLSDCWTKAKVRWQKF